MQLRGMRGGMVEPQRVIDVEFEVVSDAYRPFRFDWWAIFVFLIYSVPMALMAASDEDPLLRGICAFSAAFVVPVGNLLSSLTQRVSESEAQQLRSHLLRRGR